MPSSLLFTPLTLRGATFRNRVVMSPMCQYMARGGVASDWHLVHLGSRAVGGAGLVTVEATAVAPEGRISPGCLGLWNDEQAAALSRIAKFLSEQGAVAGIQLSHAGRKGSRRPPAAGGAALSTSEDGWTVVAPSAIAFDACSPVPRALTVHDIDEVIGAFRWAALRAVRAGFRVIELNAAHGYLLHQFLSPLANCRTDNFGGSLVNRVRLVRSIAKAVRGAVGSSVALFVRVSATDWVEGGWDIEQAIAMARMLRLDGVDLVDVSSGGLLPDAKMEAFAGYQVPFAHAIRERAGVPTAAVGGIRSAEHAEEVLRTASADMVCLGRALLRQPYWSVDAHEALLGHAPLPLPYRSAA